MADRRERTKQRKEGEENRNKRGREDGGLVSVDE